MAEFSRLRALFDERLSLRSFVPTPDGLVPTFAGEDALLLETFGDRGEVWLLTEEETLHFEKRLAPSPDPGPYWLGRSRGEVLDSGHDLLGEALLGRSYDAYENVLPPFREGAYFPLGFHASPRSLTADLSGRVYAQDPFLGVWQPGAFPAPDWDPAELGLRSPELGLLDGELPLLFGRFSFDGGTAEVMYLSEIGDLVRRREDTWVSGAALWLRVVREGPEGLSVSYLTAGLTGDHPRSGLDGDVFCDAFLGELLYARRYRSALAEVSLPDGDLDRAYRGCMFALDGLYGGGARYGCRFYAIETHKNFPPNIITALMALCMSGQETRARLLYSEFLTHSVDPLGRILYRQGGAQRRASSGSEYGQLLWLFRRYERILAPHGQDPVHMETILDMARFLCRQIAPSPEAGVPLVRMCAEADANERVSDYLQNTAWAVLGLEASADIAAGYGADGAFAAEAAALLRRSLSAVLEQKAVATAWGEVVPFRADYPAVPLTLSRCCETSSPITSEELDRYYAGSWDGRSQASREQEYFENTYANYRYLPELLSSGLLPENTSRSILAMRRAVGGELLSMTRFAEGLDDWPVWNQASVLLSLGETDRFWQLLCAHVRFHGLQPFFGYYEQVTFSDDAALVSGDLSVGCLLTPPLLVLMGLAYEEHDGSLSLLKGIPGEVLRRGLSFEGIRVCGGSADVRVWPEDGRLRCRVRLNGLEHRTVRLFAGGLQPPLPLDGAVTEQTLVLTETEKGS